MGQSPRGPSEGMASTFFSKRIDQFGHTLMMGEVMEVLSSSSYGDEEDPVMLTL